jgi:electron transfer flavoprotein beta subunit
VHFVVCIKQVPDTSQVRIDPETGSLVRRGIPSVINPFDLYALEAALIIRDRLGAFITVLSMGPPQAEEALRKALGYGADRAVLLTDRAFAGADTLATTYALAAAIRKIAEEEPVDIVFCGKQSIDGDTGQVGPGLARRLDFGQLTYVCSPGEVDAEAGVIRCYRQQEDGQELLEVRLPAAVTITEQCTRIRYASLKDLLAAASKEVEVWSAGDLDVERARLGLKGSPTRVSKIFAPPPRERGEILTGEGRSTAEATELLMDRLAERGVGFAGGNTAG